MKIKTLQKPELDSYLQIIWDMLEFSYKDIGGCLTYKSDFNNFKRNLNFAKVVLNDNNEVIACATYRTYAYDDSKKMIACGCDQSEEGKQALQELIKEDIRDRDLHYWVECDGAIEHWFKKFNGYPIPNMLVAEILKTSSKNILEDPDKCHYKRDILNNGDLYRKIMFGFRSLETFNKVQEAVDNYEEFRKEVNSLDESYSYKDISLVKQACEVLEDILTLEEEAGLESIMPIIKETIQMALDVLKGAENMKELNPKYIEAYKDIGKQLLNDLVVVEPHELNI